MRAMIITGTHPETVSGAVATVVQAARDASVELVCTPDELEKHGDAAAGIESAEDGERPDLCIVLGGDGSILYALRRFSDTGIPVFGMNFGTVGFLAAVERDQLDDGLRRAFTGDFVVLDLPALKVDLPVERPVALNDVSFNSGPTGGSPSSPTGSGMTRWERSLRRSGGRDAGGIDGLQPRQRGADPGMGREGIRGELHRPSHPHRAGPGGGPR